MKVKVWEIRGEMSGYCEGEWFAKGESSVGPVWYATWWFGWGCGCGMVVCVRIWVYGDSEEWGGGERKGRKEGREWW